VAIEVTGTSAERLATALLLVVALVAATFAASTTTTPSAKAAAGTIPVKGCPEDPNKPPPCNGDNVILRWDEQLLASIRANPAGTGPTVSARALGVLHTSTYDAWAAYDAVAKGTRLGSQLRQPASQRTGQLGLDNKSKAISYAAYKTLVDLFPNRRTIFAAQMTALGYDPNDTSTNTTTPQGVGNKAAEANIAFRHADGSNQTLNVNDPSNPNDDTVTYPDPACTPTPKPNCYTPKNPWNSVNVHGAWQPLCVLTAKGVQNNMPPIPPDNNCGDVAPTENYAIQKPLTPQWGNITSFASSPAQYKVTGPPKNPDGTYSDAEVVTALNDTSNLDDRKKAQAEYWADGPASEFPPGHMAVFAQALSRKNGNSLDTDAKVFFALGNALLDASIGSWWTKYKYDFWRPATAIRYLYQGQLVNSWLGPGHNPSFGMVPGEQWIPYQALTVVTPPFPEYVSGHSTFSAAGGVVLTSSTSSDIFGGTVTIPAGSLKIEPGVPYQDVTFTWPTFTAAADDAGMSRRYGGIHFKSGDMHGRMLGNLLGRGAYAKAQTYIQGRTPG
jgi:PAP2 superfamily